MTGLLAEFFWARFHRTRLVDWPGFSNGRRPVPIIMAFVAIVFAAPCLWVWPPIGEALESFSDWMSGPGAWRGRLRGGEPGAAGDRAAPVPERALQSGSYTKPDGTVVHGVITVFLAGDPDAGQFTTGFFPIRMFALPAAAPAITHSSRPNRRKEVGGLMLSVAPTSFGTGITEPIASSCLFIAPVLCAVHALLTGVWTAVTWALGVKDGFSFSAGLIGYVIDRNLAKTMADHSDRSGLRAPHYVIFRFAITKFGLKIPGREPEEEVEDSAKA